MRIILITLLTLSCLDSFGQTHLKPPWGYYAANGLLTGHKLQRKFGRNPDIDTGTTPEDVWAVGGVYSFPSSAQETNVISSAASDADGGTGCDLITVRGLNDSYEEIEENVAVTGTTQNVLENQYFRITTAFCIAGGSSDSNDGNIDIRHGTTVLGRIPINEGRTLQVIYTVPANKVWLVDNFTVSLQRSSASTFVVVEAQIRPFGTGKWQTIINFGNQSGGTSLARQSPSPVRPFVVPPKTDVRIRVVETSANNAQISANVAGILVDNTFPGW